MSKLNEKFWSTFLKENNLTPEEVMSVMDSLQTKKELSEKSKNYQDLADSINDTIYDDGFIANVRIDKNTIIPLLVRHLIIDETALNEVNDDNRGTVCFMSGAPALALTRSGDEFFASDKIYIVEFVEDQIEELVDGFNSSDPFEISRADMQIIGWHDMNTKLCKSFIKPYQVESIEPADLTFLDKFTETLEDDATEIINTEEPLFNNESDDILAQRPNLNEAIDTSDNTNINNIKTFLTKIINKLNEFNKEQTVYQPRILFDKIEVCDSDKRKTENSFSSTFKFMKLEDNFLVFSNNDDFGERNSYTGLWLDFIATTDFKYYTENKRLVIECKKAKYEQKIIIGLMDGAGMIVDIAQL